MNIIFAQFDLMLQGYIDVDWTSCPLSRKFIIGQCVTLGHSVVSWKSKRQEVVSRSSIEFEYRAIASVSVNLFGFTDFWQT